MNKKRSDEKDVKKDEKEVSYICIATELRDAVVRELSGAPFARVAPLLDVLARVPVNKVNRDEIKVHEEEKVPSTTRDSSDTAAQG